MTAAGLVGSSSLVGIQANQIETVWPDIEHLILQALTKTGSIHDYSPDDLKHLCTEKKMQLWIAHTDKPIAACLTRILIFPKRKVFSLFLMASESNTLPEWWHFIEVLKAYGRENGCSAIRLGGRKGWLKKFNPDYTTTLFTAGI